MSLRERVGPYNLPPASLVSVRPCMVIVGAVFPCSRRRPRMLLTGRTPSPAQRDRQTETERAENERSKRNNSKQETKKRIGCLPLSLAAYAVCSVGVFNAEPLAVLARGRQSDGRRCDSATRGPPAAGPLLRLEEVDTGRRERESRRRAIQSRREDRQAC